MSAVPRDDRERSNPRQPPAEAAWQERRGLTFSQAEALLDQLEAAGILWRQTCLEPGGITVRWRAE
jgi:hypothetical protein